MPQPGLHAILALATRKRFPRKPLFATGLVFGSLVPDLDGYAQAFATMVLRVDPVQAEATYHRTLTHSLLFSLLVALISLPKKWWFGLGLATGMAVLHTFVDIFAWFDGVGILWPFWSLDLWPRMHLNYVSQNFLRGWNFIAFSLYFLTLLKLAQRSGTNTQYFPYARRYLEIQAVFGVGLACLALRIEPTIYNLIDGAILLLWAYPNALWVTWKMRETIEATAHE